MARLTGTTIVVHAGTPVVLAEGDLLPDWAVGLVGDHLLDEPAEAKPDEGSNATEGTDATTESDQDADTLPGDGDSEADADEPAEAKPASRRRR